ncbi:MAG TPA: sigma-70 family RNA polymerase sigma factor [Ktedonobacterales bacterium]
MTTQRDADDERLEATLIARSRAGDTRAFNQLVERHQASAYALALRMVGDPDVAADVTQDAFFSAYRAINAFKGASFRAWLYRIVSNSCFDHFRAQGRHPATSLDAALGAEPGESSGPTGEARLGSALVDPSYDPEGITLRVEMIEQIQRALLQLAPEQRLAVILCDVQGLPYDEIARIMNTAPGTVKSRISRARGRLREILAAQPELFGSGDRQSTERERH